MPCLHQEVPLRRFTWRVTVLFAMAWLLCLLPFAFEGTLPGGFAADTNRLFVPFRAFLLREFWGLNFPDRAAGMFFGHPILTFGQTGVLYPTNLLGLLVAIPHHAFFLTDLWLHATLASAGMTWMVRRRGHGMAAALMIGWVYANSSLFLFRVQGHWTLVHQAALLPWMLGLWESLDGWRPGRMMTHRVALTVVLGLMLLAQNPQWLYLFALLLAPLEFLRSIRRRQRLTPMRRWAGLALIAAGAFLLGAAGYLPAVLARAESMRAALAGPDFIRNWTLPPVNLLALFSPYYFFGEQVWQFSGRWWPNESVVIVGRGVALLAGVGVVALVRRPKRLLGRGALPIMLVVCGLLLGMAPEYPPTHALVEQLPLYTSFRAWGRASAAVVVGILLLAAEGLDGIYRGRSHRLRLFAVTLGGLFSALALLAYWDVAWGGRWLQTMAESLGVASWMSGGDESQIAAGVARLSGSLLRDALWYGAWTAVLFLSSFRTRGRLLIGALLLALELFAFQRFVFRERAPVLTPQAIPELAEWLDRQIAISHPIPVTVSFGARELRNFALQMPGLRDIQGADSDGRRTYGMWLNEVQGLQDSTYQLDSQILTYTVDLRDATGVSTRVEGPEFIPPDAHWARIGPYWVLHDPTSPAAVDFDAEGTVSVVSWSNDSLELHLHAEEPGTLRLRVFEDPGWTMWVDGEMRNFQSRISLEIGDHVIRMESIDWRARTGVAVSVVSWLALGAIVLVRQRRRSSMAFSKRSVAAR